MHLNRDQAMAVNAVRNAGYNPIIAVVLTGRHRKLHCGVVSVSAVKDTERFNIRVGVDSRKNHSEILTVDRLNTVINKDKSTNVKSVDGCVVKAIHRTIVN
jgi:hypothetical protein